MALPMSHKKYIWYRGLCNIGYPSEAHLGGLVQDCSTSSALAMELLQSCTQPSILHQRLAKHSKRYGNKRILRDFSFMWGFEEYPSLEQSRDHQNCVIDGLSEEDFFYFMSFLRDGLPIKFSCCTSTCCYILVSKSFTHDSRTGV